MFDQVELARVRREEMLREAALERLIASAPRTRTARILALIAPLLWLALAIAATFAVLV